ncbi:MAG: glycosyltransferase family 2 protein [Acidobacteriota bacterium]
MQPRIAVLLPTFNGERYLTEQLDSLIGQTYHNLIIILRDDGSSDGTLEIIKTYRSKYPEKFHIAEDDGHNLGAGAGFSRLMDYALTHKNLLGLGKAYMMFCDQDDVWTTGKTALMIQAMEASEVGGGDRPVLVHSDLKVVSESGAFIAGSFMRYQGLDASKNRLGQILVCNPVTGCASMINEALARKALPIPDAAIMHDWWLALVASAFGRLVFIEQPLVQYRQHPHNTLGAMKRTPPRSFREMAGKLYGVEPDPLMYDAARQADAFLKKYRKELRAPQLFRLSITSVLRTRSGVLQRAFRRLARKL